MGRLSVEAVQGRDREVVLATTFVAGLVGLLSQILRDILYAIADPRVSYD
jgi:peptide/nickel transport system permease protein